MKYPKIILLGGSGFVGRHLAIALAQRGYQVSLPCRRPHRLNDLRVLPNIELREADIMAQGALIELCNGHDAVFNLVGILNESKKASFRQLHVEFVKHIVEACQKNNIKRLLHISALGADQASGSSLYLRSKGEGENLIHTFGQHKLAVTSFQPSVIFGPDDSFINRFGTLLKLCFGTFPLACPNSRFSPVYVGDAVRIMTDCVDDPGAFSKRYPLCGAETWTLQQIVEMIAQAQGSKCKIIGLPDSLSKLQAMLLQNLPGKLFTLDNYRSLQTPSTCNAATPICPTSLSGYLRGLAGMHSNQTLYDGYRKRINS